MSLFGKLLGRRSPQEERVRADELFAQGQFGAAKLAYEKASDGLAESDATVNASVMEQKNALGVRIDECRDAIARTRIAEAKRMLGEGSRELAEEELHSAAQTAASLALLHEIEQQLEALHRKEVREEIAGAEPEDEHRFEILAASFEDDQLAEYNAHGAAMQSALLLLHDGQFEPARLALETIMQGADAPRFLWFELGRARLACGDKDGGAQALERFLASLQPEEGGEARLSTHVELANVAHERNDFDAAVAQLEAALAAMPDDPRPYLAMASFFRRQQLSDEAIEVLEAGLSVLDETRPDVRVWQELGLAHADAGRDDEAMHWLERALDFLVARRQLDLPPEPALRLCQLYEKSGETVRALDLMALLAKGSDRPNLCAYHMEAARLMTKLELGAEARRMLQRASELAPDDAIRAAIDKQLADAS